MTTEAAQAVAEKSGPIGDILSWIELLNGWGTIGLFLLICCIGWMFYRLNSGATPYRFGDTLIDPMTGKGSITRTSFLMVVLWAMGSISYCVLVKQPVPGEIVAVLGIVVAPMITGRWFDTKDPRVAAQAATMGPPTESQPASASAINQEVKP